MMTEYLKLFFGMGCSILIFFSKPYTVTFQKVNLNAFESVGFVKILFFFSPQFRIRRIERVIQSMQGVCQLSLRKNDMKWCILVYTIRSIGKVVLELFLLPLIFGVG